MSNNVEKIQSKIAELEKYNSTAKGTSVYCDVCKVSITSHSNFLEHVAGKKHKKKAGLQPNVTKSYDAKNATESGKKLMKEHNTYNSPSKLNARTNNLRYFDYNPNYLAQQNDSEMYHINDRGYKDHSYYGYCYEDRRDSSFMPLRFEPHQYGFQYRSNDFDQHLNRSVESSFDSPGLETSNGQSSCVEPAKSNELSSPYLDASKTNSSVLKSYSNSKFSRTSKSHSNSKFSSSSKSSNYNHSMGAKSVVNLRPSCSNNSIVSLNKSTTLKKQLSDSETIKDSSNLSETADGEKAEEQKLANKVAHNATRFVYPFTQKDKAVVGHLLHQLHRSKKQQNLTKLKIQSGCLEVTARNNVSKENIQNANFDSVKKEEVDNSTSSSNLFHGSSEEISEVPVIHQSNKSVEISDSSIEEVTGCKNKKKKQNKTLNLGSEKTRSNNDTEKHKKRRKKNTTHSKRRKVRRCSDVGCFDTAIDEAVFNSVQSEDSFLPTSSALGFQDSLLDSSGASADLASSNIQKLLIQSSFIQDKSISDPASFGKEMQVKAEHSDTYAKAPFLTSEEQCKSSELQTTSRPIAISSVDSLINLFASGNVKVKQEFDDPLIDVIKSVDPRELVKACEKDPAMKQMSNLIESNFLNQVYQNDVVRSSIASSENTVKIFDSTSNSNISDVPITFNVAPQLLCDKTQTPTASNEKSGHVPGRLSHVECEGSDNLVQRPEVTQMSIVTSEITNAKQDQDKSSKTLCGISEASPKEILEPVLKVVASECDMKTFPHMEDLVKELKALSSMEADIKQNLVLADEKIAEHQRIVEEWKSKKLQYQTKEEELRMKRNTVIQFMQVALGTKSEFSSCKTEISSSSNAENLADIATNSNTETTASLINVPQNVIDLLQNNSDDHLCEKTNETSDNSPQSEPDVCILESVKKVFPVVDLEAESQDQTSLGKNVLKYNAITNRPESSKTSIFDLKAFPAHQTIVNHLKVHEGYLYTCCNDSTAKRFRLDDMAEVVIYKHTYKNVSHLWVDKIFGQFDSVQSRVVVFTLCSGNNIVSMFAANDGKVLKTYHHINKITCICTGLNVCYLALLGGSVISLNMTEEREIIKSQNGSLVRIATAHQGGIRVLVTLSFAGVISIHNAETGLLIRCLKDVLKPPSHMSVYNDYAYFSSIDNISILNISTGRIERKIPLCNPVTGLVINKDYIFTSAFRGAIECYPTKNDRHVKPYTVANFKAVTCIDVYQNWVFMGNRNGEIVAVKFPPTNEVKRTH